MVSLQLRIHHHSTKHHHALHTAVAVAARENADCQIDRHHHHRRHRRPRRHRRHYHYRHRHHHHDHHYSCNGSDSKNGCQTARWPLTLASASFLAASSLPIGDPAASSALRSRKETHFLSHTGGGNTRQRQCLSYEGGGNTRQRQCS